MKGIRKKDSFLTKLGISTAVLLFSQHALAVGTPAGTPVDNMATVAYEVGGATQQVVESAPGAGNSTPGPGNGAITTFVVDNRVDFSLVQVGTAHTIVTPGDTDMFVEFLLSNDGNSAQDFNMAVTQLASGDGAVNTLVDTDVDMTDLRIRVGNGGGVPLLVDLSYGNEIAADATVTVYVFGDATTLGLVNGDIANLELSATVAAAGDASILGNDLTDDIGNLDTAGLEVVFAEGGVLGDGVESDRDGFVVESAALNVSKLATVVSDPFNGTTNPKAIPGAIVEYLIIVANGGVTDADATVVTDNLDGDVVFITGFYAGGADILVVNDGTQITPCIADGGDTDGDGCALDGQLLTIGNDIIAPITSITVTAGTSLVITYRVSIP